MAEQWTLNPQVPGSNPGGRTCKVPGQSVAARSIRCIASSQHGIPGEIHPSIHLADTLRDVSDTPAGSPFNEALSVRGAGFKRQIRPGVWRLEVTAGTHDDGAQRRESKTIEAVNSDEASAELGRFAVEVRNAPAASSREVRKITVNDAIEQFLVEHLAGEKGREPKTVNDYRRLHEQWFAPHFGSRLVRHVEPAMIDNGFGRMRRAGLSRSRMNQAKSLYGPFFRWTKARRMTSTSPMVDFQLPTSKQVSKERLPPELEELSILLNEAVAVIPDVAPLLVLGAVSGMRRGELTGLRRNRIVWKELRLTVDTAIGDSRKVKGTQRTQLLR